ncbi:MAG TPA: hypothetical protein DEO60_06125 [Bacteroidales bacterium]|nr:hypothetical protein [Bacteroidales bacterium]HBZ20684.1 hypothetical protein [Bacteroidales bacterium]
MKSGIKYNLTTYFVFIIIAIAGVLYGNTLADSYKSLRVWSFPNILLLLSGVPFLFLQAKAKLPDFWEKGITNINRLLIPLIIGIVFGILDVLVFKVVLHPGPYSELPPYTQPFPYSVFLYFSGAVEVEVFYRLIPMTLILFIGNRLKGGKYYSAFFWTGSLLTAIREPLEQISHEAAIIVIYALISGFLMNFLQAIWYRKAGFLASLSLRLGHYLIWHILLGIYIECLIS